MVSIGWMGAIVSECVGVGNQVGNRRSHKIWPRQNTGTGLYLQNRENLNVEAICFIHSKREEEVGRGRKSRRQSYDMCSKFSKGTHICQHTCTCSN